MHPTGIKINIDEWLPCSYHIHFTGPLPYQTALISEFFFGAGQHVGTGQAGTLRIIEYGFVSHRCRRLEALHLVLPSRPGSTSTPLVATIGDKTQAKPEKY